MKVVMMILCLGFFNSAFAEQVDTDCLAMTESRDVSAKVDPSIKPQDSTASQSVIKR